MSIQHLATINGETRVYLETLEAHLTPHEAHDLANKLTALAEQSERQQRTLRRPIDHCADPAQNGIGGL